VELLYVDRTELLDGHLTDVGREVLRDPPPRLGGGSRRPPGLAVDDVALDELGDGEPRGRQRPTGLDLGDELRQRRVSLCTATLRIRRLEGSVDLPALAGDRVLARVDQETPAARPEPLVPPWP
jgi:hypothetical protein